MARDLILVTASLRHDGGGTALVARLMARVAAEVAAEARVALRILDLEAASPLPSLPATVPVRHCGGSQARLAWAILRSQLGGAMSDGGRDSGRDSGRDRARDLVRAARPVLLFNHLGPARAQTLVPRGWRSPYLVTLNGIEVWSPPPAGRRRALLAATTRVAISEFTAARAREAVPGVGAIAVTHLALEERPPAGEPDERLLAAAGADFVLTVGRLSATERYKGHDAILDAWPRVLAAHPAARWVVAGEGDDRARLEAAAARLGVARSTLFTGFVSEATLAELYRRCRVFALPSRGEGFGLVYLEAMRAGRPCLALANTAPAEIVVGEETGILLDDNGAEILAAALARLLGDAELATRMGAAGAARYAARFTYPHYRDALAPHIRRLIEVPDVRH